MKRKIWIYLLTFLCLIIIGFFVIKDFTIKSIIETLNVTSITPTTSVCNGKIIKNGFIFGNKSKVVCGFCWGTAVNPDVRGQCLSPQEKIVKSSADCLRLIFCN